MNYKSNKIFMKSCAVILAVFNIFSGGVSAAPKEKIKSNSLSFTPTELVASALGVVGLTAIVTQSLSSIFKPNPEPPQPDPEEPKPNPEEPQPNPEESQPREVAKNVYEEDAREAADCAIRALHYTAYRDRPCDNLTQSEIYGQLPTVESDLDFLSWLNRPTSYVTIPSGGKYRFRVLTTENPCALKADKADLFDKFSWLVSHNFSSSSLCPPALVMTLVASNGLRSRSKSILCYFVPEGSITIIPTESPDMLTATYDEHGKLTLPAAYMLKSPSPILPNCSSCMLLTIGYWEKLPDSDEAECDALEKSLQNLKR